MGCHCRQAVVEYDSVSERNYVAGSSLKQYSQDFQTLVVHNDLHGYSQVRLPTQLISSFDLSRHMCHTNFPKLSIPEAIVGSWTWM